MTATPIASADAANARGGDRPAEAARRDRRDRPDERLGRPGCPGPRPLGLDPLRDLPLEGLPLGPRSPRLGRATGDVLGAYARCALLGPGGGALPVRHP